MTNSTGTDSFSFRVSRKWEQWRIVFMCLWIHVMDPREWISQFLHLWNTINFWVERVSFWFQISYYMLHNLPLSLPAFHLLAPKLLVSSPGFSPFQCFLSCPATSKSMVHRLCLHVKVCFLFLTEYGTTIRSSRFPNYRRPIWGDL